MPRASLTPPLIPVRGGIVEVGYVKLSKEVEQIRSVIDQWEKSVGEDVTPPQRDAIEFARLATHRWEEAHDQQRTASSVDRLRLAIKDHPRQEVRLLAVAKARFMRKGRIVGVSLFRRTWCNNVALDFLAVHPKLDELRESPISGLGSGLLHHICWVAEAIEATAIWGESTQNSRDFYDGLIDRPAQLGDLIVIMKDDYL